MQGLQFSDKDEHMYFWFPLLAGLSELTFDPRPDIRYSALEVLFDTLKFHGSAFTLPFWTRIFDSVLLPIFDHVRAEVCFWAMLPHTHQTIAALLTCVCLPATQSAQRAHMLHSFQ